MLEERLAALTAAIDRLATVLENVPVPDPAPAIVPDEEYVRPPEPEPEVEVEPEPEPEPEVEVEPEEEPEPEPEPKPKPKPAPKAAPKAAPKPAPKAKAKAAPEVTRMDVRAALVRLAELSSQAEAKAVLESVGQANTISDLDPDLYGEVIAAATAMAEQLEDL